MSRTLLVYCALLVATATSWAEPIPYTTSEQAFETTSNLVLLPQSLPGSVTARGCSQCAVIVLEVTTATTYLAGKTQVTPAEFKTLATNNRNIAIFYDPNTKKAQRIVVYGVTATPARSTIVEKRS
jgi:hypothetical protein